jgi:hypothetical protein
MQCHAYPQIKEIMRFQIQSLMVIGISPDNSAFLPVQKPPSRMETNWMAETIVWLQLKGRKKHVARPKNLRFSWFLSTIWLFNIAMENHHFII